MANTRNGLQSIPHLRDLRVHDLVAKTAHVSLKQTLRVIIALKAVSEEYDISADAILNLRHSSEKPSPAQIRRCEEAYLWMYENGALQRYLYDVEQLNDQ